LYRIIRERRSIRRFEDRSVPRPILDRVLDAALWAPSAHNRQPWRFIVISDPVTRTNLADAMAMRLTTDLRADGLAEDMILKDTNRSRQRINGAPVVIVTCLTMVEMDEYPDTYRNAFEHQMAVQGVAMAAQNLLLAAQAEGLGGCWVCAPLFCQDTVRDVLNLSGDLEPQGLILLGYSAEQREKTREPLETRVIFR
jgi:F420 biosynthesis protein FbiB-like protein